MKNYNISSREEVILTRYLMDISFNTKEFHDLSLEDLYQILQLRQEIFIVEQDCPYLDADGKDQDSYHVMGRTKNNNELVSYIRIVPPGLSYESYCSIGRVVVKETTRRIGAGKSLMEYGIEKCKELYPNASIKISAQCHLLKFYTDLGFNKIGEDYLEDDIPHMAMVLK